MCAAHYRLPIALAASLSLALAACSASPPSSPTAAQPAAQGQQQAAAEESDEIDTEATIWTVLGLAKKQSYHQPGPQTGSTVSPILWQAALDTLSFVEIRLGGPARRLAHHRMVLAAGQAERTASHHRLRPGPGVALRFGRGDGRPPGALGDRAMDRHDDRQKGRGGSRNHHPASGASAQARLGAAAELIDQLGVRRPHRPTRQRSLKRTKRSCRATISEKPKRNGSACGASERLLRGRGRPGAAEILCARNVSLSLRQAPCRACAELHDGRPRCALPAGAGVQRAAPDGLGRLRAAGRERGDRRAVPTPRVWTHENIATMRAQLQRMGFAYDWSREIATCHPEYYRHEQKMFLDFLAADLAYRRESWVNWDPVENTVLANEQVIDGRGWRSGAIVEKRLLSQWNLRITAFSDELLDALQGLERWPERVRLMQENWIGRSEGARVRFRIAGRDDDIEVFTTRPGHAVRRLVSGAVAEPSAGAAPGRARSRPRRLHRRMQPPGHQRGGDRDRREARTTPPGSKRCTRSTRAGGSRSMSPISC